MQHRSRCNLPVLLHPCHPARRRSHWFKAMTAPQTLPPTDETLANAERALKHEEFAVRLEEARLKLEATKRPWWRGADPLVLAVVAGVFTLGGNMYVAYYNAKAALSQEKEKAHNALEQA